MNNISRFLLTAIVVWITSYGLMNYFALDKLHYRGRPREHNGVTIINPVHHQPIFCSINGIVKTVLIVSTFGDAIVVQDNNGITYELPAVSCNWSY